MIDGFDISGNSGSVDFRAAKASGRQFVFARVGRGERSSATDADGLDIRWEVYRDSALDAGLLLGGYWRFFPNVDMTRQVTRFAARLAALPQGMLPPLLDIEDTGGLGRGALTDSVIRCADAIEAATGRRPMIYSFANFFATQLQEWRLDRWQRCIAHFSAVAWPDHAAVFWQHKGDVSVPWAAGNVDLQRFAARPVDLDAHTFQHELRYFIDEDGQLYGPRAKWRPLPEGTDERERQFPARIVNHTMDGFLDGTDDLFRNASGKESTFGVGGAHDPDEQDGELRQWVECDIIAESNLEGDQDPANCISFETSDGRQFLERWTPKQAESIYQGNAAVCWRYGIPPVALPDSRHDRTGIGWHRLGIDGNFPEDYPFSGRKPGTDHWSTSQGKVCPGDTRIKQLFQEGVPRIKQIVDSVRSRRTLQPDEEDDMFPFLLRCDGRPLLIVIGNQRVNVANNTERAEALSAGARELNLTGAPDLYERIVARLS